MSPSLLFLDISLTILVVWLVRRLVWKKKALPLPPGPPGLPFFGNIFDWPLKDESKLFTEWAARYGDIVHLNLAGTHIIIVNSSRTAVEMMDEKGFNYSDRQHMHFGGDLVGWHKSLIFRDFGPELKKMRQMFARTLGTRKVLVQFEVMQETRAYRMLKQAMSDSSKLGCFIREFASGIILEASHGYQVREGQDEWVKEAERVAAEAAEACNPASHLVDFIPTLERVPSWFPGASWKQQAHRLRESLHTFVDKPHEWVKQQLASGTARPSFVGLHLDRVISTPEDEEMIKWVAGTMYIAGAETTVSVIHTFFLLMLLFPEVQARAQAEVDAVIGPERLPRISDRDRLPYVRAVILEVMRWASASPSGVPHKVRDDDVQDGYLIPKGTVVIPNLWFIARDPRVYSDPESFRPERFLGSTPEQNPSEYVFGFGRRICPGQELAEASVFSVCASALVTLNISKAADENGHLITPPFEYIGSAVRQPKDFLCDIKPRSRRAQSLLEAAYEASR